MNFIESIETAFKLAFAFPFVYWLISICLDSFCGTLALYLSLLPSIKNQSLIIENKVVSLVKSEEFIWNYHNLFTLILCDLEINPVLLVILLTASLNFLCHTKALRKYYRGGRIRLAYLNRHKELCFGQSFLVCHVEYKICDDNYDSGDSIWNLFGLSNSVRSSSANVVSWR